MIFIYIGISGKQYHNISVVLFICIAACIGVLSICIADILVIYGIVYSCRKIYILIPI